MARLSLQVKNVASLLLATGASIAWGVAAKRFFDSPGKPWIAFGIAGAVLLGCQLSLIFVESKEEEELSLFRRERMAGVEQTINESRKLSERIQLEIEGGNLESLQKWEAHRRRHHGK